MLGAGVRRRDAAGGLSGYRLRLLLKGVVPDLTLCPQFPSEANEPSGLRSRFAPSPILTECARSPTPLRGLS